MAFSVAAPTVPVIRIRAPAANSLSIDPPLLSGATGQGVEPDSATTIAGTKPRWAASSAQAGNDRRHLSSNVRETPYRGAVAATWRGACKLSMTRKKESLSTSVTL
ncbi:hypothetical protein [Bradyrhizobium sp. 153]|uniref:hypothetical protein n=1 Tax=Bradyrhizobium sp. 153 TaxID=2782627 RepID=UPI001FFB3228|nr:hypothetical protein [Bradyrhizobium sp. 153]MCK1667875.1 hypothetical protein [Bradyrhizobium sp. 153]